MGPHPIERLGHDLGVLDRCGEQRRPRAEDHLGHRQRLLGVALFDHLGKALRKIRLIGELREMGRQGLGKGAHPIDRHHLDRAPWAKRARIERFGEAHELGGFATEVAAQFLWLCECLVIEHAFGADIAKRSRQLIMVGVSARQAIVVDKYLKLALAQGWAVEVRQIINGGTCGVHRRLIDKVYLTEKCRIAGGRVVEGREIAEEGHP